jgi:hypothetical protein
MNFLDHMNMTHCFYKICGNIKGKVSIITILGINKSLIPALIVEVAKANSGSHLVF